MLDFFNWLSGGSVSSIVFIVTICLLIFGIALAYAVAFFQGREISFWPPKIGAKPAWKNTSKPKKWYRSNAFKSISEVFQTEPTSLDEEISDFTELYVVAMNMRRTLTNYYGIFEHKLKDGANLRFLLVDPTSDAVPIIAERNYVYRDVEKLQEAIQSTLDNLSYLAKTKPVKGSLEFKVLRFVPSFGMTLVNPERPDGKIRVDLYPYRVPPDTYPSFWVTRESDEHWYQFFLEQFYLLWESGKHLEQDVAAS